MMREKKIHPANTRPIEFMFKGGRFYVRPSGESHAVEAARNRVRRILGDDAGRLMSNPGQWREFRLRSTQCLREFSIDREVAETDHDYDRSFCKPAAWRNVKKALDTTDFRHLFPRLERLAAGGCVRWRLAIALHAYLAATDAEREVMKHAYFDWMGCVSFDELHPKGMTRTRDHSNALRDGRMSPFEELSADELAEIEDDFADVVALFERSVT